MTLSPLATRMRSVTPDGTDRIQTVLRPDWDSARAAVIVCDMWDAHHCVTAARRVSAMAPRVNALVAELRARSSLIVHAPGDCSGFYADTAPRTRTIEAPHAPAPTRIDWNGWEHDDASALPTTLTAPGPCSCHSAAPCCDDPPPSPWTRETPLITIEPADAVSDDGQEIFNLLEQRAVTDVIVTGVHLNICVLARPYGIRQLVYLGKRPLLCRDVTDSFHRDPRGHLWGTEQVVAHIERRWCPTITSDQILGGEPFHFAASDRPPASGWA